MIALHTTCTNAVKDQQTVLKTYQTFEEAVAIYQTLEQDIYKEGHNCLDCTFLKYSSRDITKVFV